MNAISAIVADNTVLVQAAEKLVQAITRDESESGGLVSRATLRASEELRVALHRYQSRRKVAS